jgi:L-asparaginase/Glu-tRNA(Gln) amidotransferase subunit D
MKTPSWILTVAAALLASGTALAQQSGPLPKVRVLATGGTIAGAQASATDYGYKSGAY